MNWRLGFKPQYITYGQVSYGCRALTPDESVSQANRGLYAPEIISGCKCSLDDPGGAEGLREGGMLASKELALI